MLEARQHIGRAPAGLQCHGLANDVHQAQRQGLIGTQPAFFVEHLNERGVFDGGSLAPVGRQDAVARLVHHVGGFAQVLGTAVGEGPRVVDHQHGVGRHHHLMPATGDDTGSRCGQAVDAHGAARTQTQQRVMNGKPVEHITARAVDGDRDRGLPIVDCLELVDESGGADAPQPDLVIDQHFDGFRLIGISFGLNAVPAARWCSLGKVAHAGSSRLEMGGVVVAVGAAGLARASES